MNTLRWPVLALIVFALALGGCASTKKRYEKATTLEAQGRWAEAAQYYIKVLEKEPNWEDARERLHAVGALAVESYLAEADAEAGAGRPATALGLLDTLDDLRDDARSVGVTLAVPDDYAAQRADLAHLAYENFFNRGDQAEQARHWSEALSAYERAGRYATTRDAEAITEEARGRVQLKWADEEASRGYYRSGYGHAAEALAILGPEHPLGRRALALQDETLRAGTRYVAFLPLWQTESARVAVPEHLIDDLNEILLVDHWGAPVPFVAAAEPVAVRRELRRLHFDRTILSRVQAAEVGRALDADFVVTGEITALEAVERKIQQKRHKAVLLTRPSTTRGGGRVDTAYVEQTYTLTFDATIDYRIVDAASRRVVDQGTVTARTSDRLRRAVFDGDYRNLDLSGSERALFEEADLARDALADELADELAARFAERAYERLVNSIR